MSKKEGSQGCFHFLFFFFFSVSHFLVCQLLLTFFLGPSLAPPLGSGQRDLNFLLSLDTRVEPKVSSRTRTFIYLLKKKGGLFDLICSCHRTFHHVPIHGGKESMALPSSPFTDQSRPIKGPRRFSLWVSRRGRDSNEIEERSRKRSSGRIKWVWHLHFITGSDLFESLLRFVTQSYGSPSFTCHNRSRGVPYHVSVDSGSRVFRRRRDLVRVANVEVIYWHRPQRVG